MSNDSDRAWQGHSPLVPLPTSRRRWPWLLLIVLLTLAGAGGVYAWPEIAPLIPSLGHETSGGKMAAGDSETLPDLLASQQKTGEDLAALGRAVADQQEQLKILADRLAALTSKVDALQSPPSAPVSPPAAAEPPRAPTAQAAPRPIAQAAPKPGKPPSRTPSGPISTGGAPLNAAPGETAH